MNEGLVDLKEWYGVTTLSDDSVQELMDRYYRGFEILQALDELANNIILEVTEIRDRITYL